MIRSRPASSSMKGSQPGSISASIRPLEENVMSSDALALASPPSVRTLALNSIAL